MRRGILVKCRNDGVAQPLKASSLEFRTKRHGFAVHHWHFIYKCTELEGMAIGSWRYVDVVE